jgi:flagellar biosynthesis/type III secretory pathway M-ring protein FliF/YscJ
LTQAQYTNETNPANGQVPPRNDRDSQSLTRTLIWVGVAGLSAALAFTVVRALISRRPADPTSQRIQQLIDEANSLLKTLDDQRHP